MKIQNNVKFGVKLTTLIATMTIGIIIIAVISYYYNQSAGDALNTMYSRNLLSIEHLADLRTQTRANYANIVNMIVTEDQEENQALMDNYDKRMDDITSDLEQYKEMDLDTYQSSQILVVEQNLDEWNEISDDLMNKIEGGNNTQALSSFKADGEEIFETLQSSVKELEEYEIQEAESLSTTMQNNMTRMSFINLLVSCIVVVIGVLLGVIITRSITVPIRKVIGLIEMTAELNLVYDKSFDELLKHGDEVGQIVKALANMRKKMRILAENMMSVSGEMTQNASGLAELTEENKKTIEQIAGAVNEIAQGNTQQAGAVTEVSEAVAVMTEHITEVNQSGKESSTKAKEMQGIIVSGRDAIEQTIQKMNETIEVCNDVDVSIDGLSSQMNKVGEIISVIREISAQTNLLALNASIEAARAGEAGKGFAVVATEIGQLAQDTSRAVDDISHIIQDTVTKNKETSDKVLRAKEIVDQQDEALHNTTHAFGEIKNAVESISGQIIHISDSINNIYALSEKVSDQTQNISAVSQETAASSEEISASTEHQLSGMENVATSAAGLSELANKLNLEVDKFKM